MRLLDAAELKTDVHWWELAGHYEPEALAATWRQQHHAVQAVAEAGKSWAEEKDDDSHSALVWVPDHSKLPDQFFAGELVHGELSDAGARVLLRPWDLQLFVIDAAGAPLAELNAEERTMGDLIAWVRGTLEERVGPARQEARPAPDLPSHPVATGAPFGEPNQLAVAEVIRFYANADAMLQKIAQLIETTDEPKIWPHHFDIATLATTATDGDGAMTKTIGIGLTPPDSVSETGYWYVSPWSKDGSVDDGAWPVLPRLGAAGLLGAALLALMPGCQLQAGRSGVDDELSRVKG
ncbi:MAG: hypothetical protein AAFV01_10150, partial [Bacteroidota bacterium]